MMAHSKRPQFPSWSPEDVIARWREEKREAEAGYKRTWAAMGHPERVAEYRDRAFGVPALLHRLLTDQRMREVWGAITAIGAIAEVPPTTIFAATVIRGWMGPWREERWTAGERAAWLAEVEQLCGLLAAKLQGTPADDFMTRTFLVERGMAWNVSEMLRSLGRHAGQSVKPSRLKRPKGPKARRAYLVRTLRSAYPQLPSELIAAVGAVALEDHALDGRQVRRLTADGKSRNRKK